MQLQRHLNHDLDLWGHMTS